MEHPSFQYSTVSQAIETLRKKGYTTDFNLEENCISCNGNRFGSDQFHVAEVYRYEGNTDPADEAVVYAIESDNGLKGILVTAYGIYTDPVNESILKKLHVPG